MLVDAKGTSLDTFDNDKEANDGTKQGALQWQAAALLRAGQDWPAQDMRTSLTD